MIRNLSWIYHTVKKRIRIFYMVFLFRWYISYIK